MMCDGLYRLKAAALNALEQAENDLQVCPDRFKEYITGRRDVARLFVDIIGDIERGEKEEAESAHHSEDVQCAQ